MLTLSADELRELTGARVRDAQGEWLSDRLIPFRRDGARLLVAREHVHQWLAGVEFKPTAAPRLDLVR